MTIFLSIFYATPHTPLAKTTPLSRSSVRSNNNRIGLKTRINNSPRIGPVVVYYVTHKDCSLLPFTSLPIFNHVNDVVTSHGPPGLRIPGGKEQLRLTQYLNQKGCPSLLPFRTRVGFYILDKRRIQPHFISAIIEPILC